MATNKMIGAISGENIKSLSLTSVGGVSSSISMTENLQQINLPPQPPPIDNIPQWKKELIQRRKNLATKIGVSSSSSSSPSPPPMSPIKDTLPAPLQNNCLRNSSTVTTPITSPTTTTATSSSGGFLIKTNSNTAVPGGIASSTIATNSYNVGSNIGQQSHYQQQQQQQQQIQSQKLTTTSTLPLTSTKLMLALAAGTGNNNVAAEPIAQTSNGILAECSNGGDTIKKSLNNLIDEKNQFNTNRGSEITSTIGLKNKNDFINIKCLQSKSVNKNNSVSVNNSGIYGGGVIIGHYLEKSNKYTNNIICNDIINNCVNKKYKKNNNKKMVAVQELQQHGNVENDNEKNINNIIINNTNVYNSINLDDSCDELEYGPGIVSKLRCRYLSLALRQTTNKQRPSLNNMRRATSLNNLLDEDDDCEMDDDDDDDDDDNDDEDQDNDNRLSRHNGDTINENCLINKQGNNLQQRKSNDIEQQKNTYNELNGGSGGGGGGGDNKFYNIDNKQTNNNNDNYIKLYHKNYIPNLQTVQLHKNTINRCRQNQRGNDSLKRARSVEALMRYDHKAWERDIKVDSNDHQSKQDDEEFIHQQQQLQDQKYTQHENNEENIMHTELKTEITIEDKMLNMKERCINDVKPKRCKPYMDEQERPPQDVVKAALRKFEATANRRGRSNLSRYNGGGEVAAKVATFKSIILQEKPLIVYPKPTISAKKPIAMPRSTSIISAPSPPTTTTPNNIIISKTLNNTDLTVNVKKDDQKNKTLLQNIDINLLGNKPAPTSPLKSNLIKKYCGDKLDHAPSTPTPTPPQQTSSPPPPITHRADLKEYRNNISNDSILLSPAITTSNSQLRTVNNQRPESPRTPIPTTITPSTTDNLLIVNNINKKLIINDNLIESPITNISNKITTLTIDNKSQSSNQVIASATSSTPKNNYSKIIGFDFSADQDTNYLNYNDNNITDNANNLTILDNNVALHSNDDAEDGVDDEDSLDAAMRTENRRISKKAMDNISRAGLTTEFKFDNGDGGNGVINHSINTKIKSYLPVLTNGNCVTNATVSQAAARAKIQQQMQSTIIGGLSENEAATLASQQQQNSGRQVVVIRPLLAEPKIKNNTPGSNVLMSSVPVSEAINQEKLKLRDNLLINNTITGLPPTGKDKIVSSVNSGSGTGTGVGIIKQILTTREIEKNLINKEKNEELLDLCNNINDSNAATPPSSGITGGNGTLVTKWGIKKKSWNQPSNTQSPQTTITSSGSMSSPFTSPGQHHLHHQEQQPTTMVFNFSNRKEVPDYIENDGLLLRRKRELPKPGESGFVLLNDVQLLETSTDNDDPWTMGPPSPCNVEFENDNIIINGKSNLRNKSASRLSDNKGKLQFNDLLTSTFEYPSESSLLEDSINSSDCSSSSSNINNTINSENQTGGIGSPMMSTNVGNGGGITGTSTSNFIPGVVTTGQKFTMPMGSAPLGNYTPLKATINTNFELGVTRSQPLLVSNSSQQVTGNGITKSNEFKDNHGSNVDSSNNITSASMQSSHGDEHQLSDGGDSNIGAGGGDSESLQYLKPATDDQTVAWSEGTRVTDLLF